ncbi:DUF5658 family protein [Sutcliffiella cohnii]|uniref:DUF5658 family protein n=1 Tax=Sutcliffiella cohnii TaxID=33932 RepID=UPI002E1C9BF1|nr:DUF5658 family protein [Sutcliffiella cohnii]
MYGLFLSLLILNGIDGVLTFIGLKFNMIEEANPLMSLLFTHNPYLFLIIKITLSFLLLIFLIRKQIPNTRLVKILSIFATASYSYVTCLHLVWIYYWI